jgi:NADH:ubiquinone oxidoreductase subunit D
VPYSIYPELEFEVPIGTGEMGAVGDCFDRYIVRMKEMRESCKLLRQCIAQIPDGPVIAKVPRNFKPPPGHNQVDRERAATWVVRRVRRHGVSAPLQDPHGLVQCDQHRAAREPQS